ncbi:MAG: hypothetical protein M1269_12800 [Chloroflexi bacterium]|nr:hypothetical protein [Chloroflexota bacterium]
MENKIIRFPLNSKQRAINEMGQGYVPCEVSTRWLQFDEFSSLCAEEEFMSVSVMTYDKNEKPRKICDLIITREDLERTLKYVKPLNY